MSPATAGEPEATAQRLEDVLNLASWRSALFTTFSLSLGFFEAFILPKLEAVGCADVTVLVDKNFYLSSLSERQAESVGKHYRLLPVSCSGQGVFHPKLAYLTGAQFDLLSVGSGNMTYAGHGANLECIDFASSAREPAVFGEFAGFLEALLTSGTVELGEARSVVEWFQKQAARRDVAGGPAGGANLLHSCITPVGSQLVERLKAQGKFDRLVCASPFHHPAGQSLRRIANELGIGKVDVCLDPEGHRAPFALEMLAQAGLLGGFVLPDKNESRPLHAKWYDFRGVQNFTLTGSVNATNQSLWSTDNVEVAMLRESEPKQMREWIAAHPKIVEARPFERIAQESTRAITAVVGLNGVLRGAIQGTPVFAGVWQGEVVGMFERTAIGDIAVDLEGRFSFPVPSRFQDPHGAIQLRMKRDTNTAAGWITLQSYLQESVENRGARVALNRLARGEAIAGDVERLVHWLTAFVEGRVGNANPAGQRGEAKDDDAAATANRRWTYDEWMRSDGAGRAPGDNVGDLVRRALETLARGHAAATASFGVTKGHVIDVGGDSEESDRQPVREDEFDLVAELVKAIEKIVGENPDVPIAQDLAFFKLEQGLRSGLNDDLCGAFVTRALEWVRWLAQVRFSDAQRGSLAPVVVAVASSVASLAPTANAQSWRADLKELLRLFVLQGDADQLHALAMEGMAHRVMGMLNTDKRTELLEGVELLVQTRTLREELADFVQKIDAGQRPPVPGVLSQHVGLPAINALLERARDSKQKYCRIENIEQLNACPCGAGLHKDDLRELARRRAIKCRGCSRAIVWLG